MASPAASAPTDTPPLRGRLPRKRWIAGFVACLAVLLVGGFALLRYLDFNSGVVIPGELYRAGQLSPGELERQIGLYHIRAVVNLRGPNPKNAWYISELATCQRLDVRHADVRMGARHLPPPEEVTALLDAFHHLPRPLLVHCGSGSDRSGLASSIYLMEQKGRPPEEAERQLSVQFGHLAVYPYFEMNEFVELYGEENPQHHTFDQWAVQDYPAIFVAESKESKWDELIEPVESLVKVRYWARK